MIQDPQKARLKIGDKKTMPIETRYVDDLVVLPEEIQEFTARVMPHCALPAEEVRKEISERAQKFLAAYDAKKQEEDDEVKKKMETPLDAPPRPFTRTKPVRKQRPHEEKET